MEKTVKEFIELFDKPVVNTVSKKVLEAKIIETNRPKKKGFNTHGTNIKHVDSWLKAMVDTTPYLVIFHTPKPQKGKEPVVRTFYKKEKA